MRTVRTGQSALLLLDAIDTLDDEGVDYLVIGAFALSAHQVIRASRDVDALLRVSRAKLGRLRGKFERAGFRVALREGDADDPIPFMLLLSDSHRNQVDLLGGLHGLDLEAFSRAVEIDFRGRKLRVAGREDLIAMKCFAGGPQDLIDARSILEACGASVNFDLLHSVARRFGRETADRLEDVLKPV